MGLDKTVTEVLYSKKGTVQGKKEVLYKYVATIERNKKESQK